MVFICPRVGQKKTRAFSLVELLMVTLIISILATLLMPTVAKVRLAVQQVRCVNNMRAIGIGHELFSQEHQDRIVPHGQFGHPPSGALVPNQRITFWPDLLLADMPDARVFKCPCSVGGPLSVGCSLGSLGPYASGRPATWLSRHRVLHPAATMMFGDAGFVTEATAVLPDANEWRKDSGIPFDPFSLRVPTDPYFSRVLTRLVNRHLGRATVGFVDGHSESIPASRVGFHLPWGHPANRWDTR
jgi:prepilin-type N-terminal cleavage/methylation domain-containing protein/prepilin-type processing-associated H-X9-DG protein